MGAAVAYWLGRFQINCPIVVVEKDPAFTQVNIVSNKDRIEVQSNFVNVCCLLYILSLWE